MIFRNPDNGDSHNITAPTDNRSQPYGCIGKLNTWGCATVIGPKLACSAAHLGVEVGGKGLKIAPGDTLNIGGVDYTISSTQLSLNCPDVQYLFFDKEFPAANIAKLWRFEVYGINNKLFYAGNGIGRGIAAIKPDGTLYGWYPGEVESAGFRWGTGVLNELVMSDQPQNRIFASRFEDPFSQAAFLESGDSGGGCFFDGGPTDSPWLYLGPAVSADGTFARFDVSLRGVIGSLIYPDLTQIDAWNGATTPAPPDTTYRCVIQKREGGGWVTIAEGPLSSVAPQKMILG